MPIFFNTPLCKVDRSCSQHPFSNKHFITVTSSRYFSHNRLQKNYDHYNLTEVFTSSGLRRANLVLIAYASSEGSGEPEPSLLAHTSSESRGTFRQKARSLAPLNGCACAVKICHDGMLEDTNSLDGAHLVSSNLFKFH